MKANPDKCHLLVSKKGSFVANIIENKISDTKTENFLGVTFDKRLTSNNHVSNLCKAACNKLNGIGRVISYMDKKEKRILFNSYFSLQLNCCPFIGMNHGRSPKDEMNYMKQP